MRGGSDWLNYHIKDLPYIHRTSHPHSQPQTHSLQISDPFVFWFSRLLKKKKLCILKTDTDVKSNFLLEVTKHTKIGQDTYFTHFKSLKIVVKQKQS